jgi:hypothetical protein
MVEEEAEVDMVYNGGYTKKKEIMILTSEQEEIAPAT